MAEILGYTAVASIHRIGSSTAATGNSLSLVGGRTYRTAITPREIWDVSQAVTIYDNGSPVASSNIESIDFLFGQVTFASSYTVTGPVTADHHYHTKAIVAAAKGASFQATRELLETSRFNRAYRSRVAGLKMASGTLEYIGFLGDAATGGYLSDFVDGDDAIIDFHWLSTDSSYATTRRARAKLTSLAPNATIDSLVGDTVSWESTVWEHADGWAGSFSFGRPGV